MSRISAVAIFLLAGILGARLPLGDRGYRDLALGRSLATEGSPYPVEVAGARDGPSSGWLGSRLLYYTARVTSPAGLRVWSFLLFGTAGLILYLVSSRPMGGTLAFALAMAASFVGFQTFELGTSLFAWPLWALALLLARDVSDDPRPAWLIAMPLVPTLWSNLSSDAALGAGLFVASALLLSMLYAPRTLLWTALGTALALVTLLYTPGGWAKIQNPFLEPALLKDAGISSWDAVRPGSDGLFFCLLPIVAGAIVVSTKRQPADTVIGLALLVSCFVSRHFAPFAAAWAVGPTVSWFRSVSERVSGRFASAVVILAAAAATAHAAWPTLRPHPFTEAVSLLSREPVSGPLLNVPETGGLLAWRRPQGLVVFSDPSVSSLAAFSGENFPSFLFERGVGVAVLTPSFARRHLEELRTLALTPVYFDDDAIVYAERSRNPVLVEARGFRRFDPLRETYAVTELALAADELQRYMDRNRPFASGLLELGDLLVRLEKPEQAIKELEAARRLGPNRADVLEQLGALYVQKGMYRLAEEASRQGLGVRHDSGLYRSLGLSLHGQGREEEAAAALEDALKGNAEDLGARRALMEVYRSLGKDVLADAQGAEVNRLEDAQVASLLADAANRYRDGDFRGASVGYRDAVALRPKDANTYWQLAIAQLAEENYADAGETLRELLRVNPDDSEAQLVMGVLCLDSISCRGEETRAHLQMFLELAPFDPNRPLAEEKLKELRARRF